MASAPPRYRYTYAPRYPQIHVTGRRVVAVIIDSILLSIAVSLIALVFGAFSGGDSNDTTIEIGIGTGDSLLYGLLAFVYYTLMEGSRGQTIGKMITGIRVASETTGQPPGLGAAAIRTLLRLIDAILGYLVGFLIVLSSAKRQRLGDMAAHTLVIRTLPDPRGRQGQPQPARAWRPRGGQ
jgi:uncharacterized RDD family membrane protein YckC